MGKKKLPTAKIIKGKKPKANDEGVPEDEITLAQLIQNAAARGLTSVRGTLFGREITAEELSAQETIGGLDWDDPEYDKAQRIVDSLNELSNYDNLTGIYIAKVEEDAVEKPGCMKAPPKGATCACALGAQLLSPKVDNPVSVTAMQANDPEDGEIITFYEDQRSADIGAAFEQALRPE